MAELFYIGAYTIITNKMAAECENFLLKLIFFIALIVESGFMLKKIGKLNYNIDSVNETSNVLRFFLYYRFLHFSILQLISYRI